MKHIKSCNTCANGLTNNFNQDILCKIKGIVSHDFVCSKYKALPMARNLLVRKNKCVDCEFYIVDAANSVEPVPIGFCQLFTVRKFNGEAKSACSKFVRKSESIVS